MSDKYNILTSIVLSAEALRRDILRYDPENVYSELKILKTESIVRNARKVREILDKEDKERCGS